MDINEKLKNIASNMNNDTSSNNVLKIKKSLYFTDIIDDKLSEVLFISSIEFMENIKTNPNYYNIETNKIAAINNIINSRGKSFMDF